MGERLRVSSPMAMGAVALMSVVVLVCAACGGSSATPTVAIPSDWTVSRDSTGTCEVSAPPSWKLGTDFYLEKQTAVAPPGESALRPPLDVWPSAWPSGDWYQQRTSVQHGDVVCTVWRAKSSATFSPDETGQMATVGKTLKVKP